VLDIWAPFDVNRTGTITVLFGLAGMFELIESWGPANAAAEFVGTQEFNSAIPTSNAKNKTDNTNRMLNLASMVLIATPFCNLAIDSEAGNPKGLEVVLGGEC